MVADGVRWARSGVNSTACCLAIALVWDRNVWLMCSPVPACQWHATPHTLLQLIDIKQNTGSAAGHQEIADRRQEAAKRGWAKQKGLVILVNESVGEGTCKVRQVQSKRYCE